MDTLDWFVAELKKRGIYTNLNLNVGRNFRKGDGVRDHEYLGMAKVVNYFDEQVQMLHREYATQLLTHRNPYTGAEYRHEPAVAIVELVNENSLVEAWFSDRLLGKNTQKNPGTWADIPASYAEQLTEKYNRWLQETLTAGSDAIAAEGGRSRGRSADSAFDQGGIRQGLRRTFPRRSRVLYGP